MSWTHFEEMADDYDSARPPYPDVLFEALRTEGVIGPGRRVLEIGAGSGLATRQLVASGSQVVALEPGRDLAALLARSVPAATVIRRRLEDVQLGDAEFSSAVAATSMHWIDLSIGLPRLHRCLRRDGSLAVFRNVFGDESFTTEFREHVRRIVVRRHPAAYETSPAARPTMAELAAGGWFRPVRSERWTWSLELTTDQVTQLFRTFSDWSEQDVEEVRAAAETCGGRVTEHFQTLLHVLRPA